MKYDDDNILPGDLVTTTECDQCGLHDYDDKTVEVEDAAGVPVMTFCADCAEEVTCDRT